MFPVIVGMNGDVVFGALLFDCESAGCLLFETSRPLMKLKLIKLLFLIQYITCM